METEIYDLNDYELNQKNYLKDKPGQNPCFPRNGSLNKPEMKNNNQMTLENELEDIEKSKRILKIKQICKNLKL